MYQHNIEREESPSTWSLLATRLQLFHLLEEWHRKLDPCLKLITPQEIKRILPPQRIEGRFRLSLTMHYYRALIMLNGPVLTVLLDIVVASSHGDAEVKSLVEQCVPTLRGDLVALESLHQMLSVSSQSESFLNHHNMWWFCNHASTNTTLQLHMASLMGSRFNTGHASFLPCTAVSGASRFGNHG